MRLAYVSVFALAVAMGAPALAQAPATPGTAAGTGVMQSQSMGVDQIKDRLDQAGIEDGKEFKGNLVRAETPEGHAVMLVVGPENLEGDKSIDFSQDEVRGKLTQAGFRNISFIDNSNVVRGKMGDDKAILAMSGDQGWRGTPGPAQSSMPDRQRLTDDLEKVGLSDSQELKGKLVRAQAGGRTIFVLVGPEDFKGDASAEFSATELTKLQQSGFQSAEVVEDATILRGTMDDWTVIALAGSAISDPIATGTTGGATGTVPAR